MRWISDEELKAKLNELRNLDGEYCNSFTNEAGNKSIEFDSLEDVIDSCKEMPLKDADPTIEDIAASLTIEDWKKLVKIALGVIPFFGDAQEKVLKRIWDGIWNPYKENSPERKINYLIQTEKFGMMVAHPATGFWVIDYLGTISNYDIVAWIPLPPAYKPEGREL